MKKNVLLLFLLATGFVIQAQDNNAQAIVYYNKAEAAYNNAAYEDVLNYLDQAETLLGASNSKLLFLKIQTLNLLSKIDDSRLIQLKQVITQFYQSIDQNTYPKDKLMEITSIEIDANTKLTDEENAYKKTKASDNISDYERFFNAFPKSKYDAELRPKYNAFIQQKKDADQKALIEDWRSKNSSLMKKYNTVGKKLVISGAVITVAGGALVAYGIYAYTNTQGQFAYNPTLQPIVISTLVIGSSCLTTGIILLATGGNYLHKSIKIKEEARKKNIDLSIAPILNPMIKNYSFAFDIKF
jgi:hypothetical protein